jgi:hypothetical protein
MPAPTPRSLSEFPQTTFDKLRYNDTDRQGHVNNAVFATLLESGRVEFLYAPEGALHDPRLRLCDRQPEPEFYEGNQLAGPGGHWHRGGRHGPQLVHAGARPVSKRAVRGHRANHHRADEREHAALASNCQQRPSSASMA